jgi:hypothetical protein
MKWSIFFLCISALAQIPQLNKSSEDFWKILEDPVNTPEKPSTAVKNLYHSPVVLSGWLIPNEFEKSEIKNFLLAHYPVGCIHVPLPPPKSLIEVVLSDQAPKLKATMKALRVSVTGIFEGGSRVDTAYKIQANIVKIEEP